MQLDDISPVGTFAQQPRKISNASWKITDLLRFPIDDKNWNLRCSDRIFTSLDRKSVMLMREYDDFPNHVQQESQSKSNNLYQKQSGMHDRQKRHIESDQRRHQRLDQHHPRFNHQC